MTGRIMIVEDERIVALDLRQTLESFGHDVVMVVSSGEQAVAEGPQLKPDLVLMDIHLDGEMDGTEAARVFQQHNIPVLFLTAFAGQSMLDQAEKSSPYGYLVKPVETRALQATVRMALARRRAELDVERGEERLRLAVDVAGLGVWEWDAAARQFIGEGQFGDPCIRDENNDDCAVGLFCMTQTSGSTGEGVCLNLCDVNDADSCANKGQADADCIAFNNGVLPLCESPCDPLIQDCPDGQGCYAGGDSFVCAVTLDGAPPDNGECYTIQSCLPGNVCVGSGSLEMGTCASERCCTPWCDLNGDPDAQCPEPTEDCVPWYEPGTAPPQHEDVGACLVPA